MPVAVDTWGPFVFVNPEPTPAPLAEHLGDLPRLVAEGGVDVDALVFHQRAESEYDANWKVCVENYLECYHCAVAHPSFSKAIDVAPGTYTLEEHPTFSSQYGPRRTAAAESTTPTVRSTVGSSTCSSRGRRSTSCPAAATSRSARRAARGRAHVSLPRLLLPARDRGQWIADYLELDSQVGAEDRVLVERVQVGMRSGMIREAR